MLLVRCVLLVPPYLLFGAIIVRTSRTNRAGVWIVRPTHALCNDLSSVRDR